MSGWQQWPQFFSYEFLCVLSGRGIRGEMPRLQWLLAKSESEVQMGLADACWCPVAPLSRAKAAGSDGSWRQHHLTRECRGLKKSLHVNILIIICTWPMFWLVSGPRLWMPWFPMLQWQVSSCHYGLETLKCLWNCNAEVESVAKLLLASQLTGLIIEL